MMQSTLLLFFNKIKIKKMKLVQVLAVITFIFNIGFLLFLTKLHMLGDTNLLQNHFDKNKMNLLQKYKLYMLCKT